MIDMDVVRDKLAQYWTDTMEIDDLMRFFYDAQMEYLEDLEDEEVLKMAKHSGLEV